MVYYFTFGTFWRDVSRREQGADEMEANAANPNFGTDSYRRQRMRAHIRGTLLDLLQTNDIEQLSMKKLAEAAQVNRSTVYQYYDSLLSVLGDCISHKAGNANHRIPAPDDEDFYEQIRQVVLDSLRGIRENLDLYHLVQRCGSKTGPARHNAILQKNALTFYEGITEGLVARNEALSGYRRYLPSLLSNASGSISRKWIEGGCREAPEFIADFTMSVFQGIVDSLDNTAKNVSPALGSS